MSERIQNDAYFTPPTLAQAIVARLVERHLLRVGQRVWEPHAGAGSFARALAAQSGAFVYASDISPDMPSGDELEAHGIAGWKASHNALAGWWLDDGPPDWIVGNPPFSEAEEHVRALLPIARYGVAFITRQSFTATAKRADLARQVWQVWPINPRPSFTPDGKTDACEYNVVLFVKNHGLAERPIDPITWIKP